MMQDVVPMQGGILDVRAAAAFSNGHHPNGANIPLEELAERIHELPRRDTRLLIYDDHPTRARWARSRLRARGFESVAIADADGLNRGTWIAGPARVRLWQPHALLVEALAIIRACDAQCSSNPGRVASTSASDAEDRLRPCAADLACGAGRDAVHLALAGYRADAFDILSDALARATDLARRSGTSVNARLADLESNASLPPDTYDLIITFNFQHRPLFTVLRNAVRPGGWVVYETFVEPQCERFGKPRRESLVLRPGELRERFTDWEIHVYREGLVSSRRIAASLIARKPP